MKATSITLIVLLVSIHIRAGTEPKELSDGLVGVQPPVPQNAVKWQMQEGFKWSSTRKGMNKIAWPTWKNVLFGVLAQSLKKRWRPAAVKEYATPMVNKFGGNIDAVGFSYVIDGNRFQFVCTRHRVFGVIVFNEEIQKHKPKEIFGTFVRESEFKNINGKVILSNTFENGDCWRLNKDRQVLTVAFGFSRSPSMDPHDSPKLLRSLPHPMDAPPPTIRRVWPKDGDVIVTEQPKIRIEMDTPLADAYRFSKDRVWIRLDGKLLKKVSVEGNTITAVPSRLAEGKHQIEIAVSYDSFPPGAETSKELSFEYRKE